LPSGEQALRSRDEASAPPRWLMAQSVPSESLAPCVQLVPVDWKIANVAVNNGRSVIILDDRGGRAAMRVELTAACDRTGATEVTSEQRGARRYYRARDATRAYTFPGG
jgi:hypothetical protein